MSASVPFRLALLVSLVVSMTLIAPRSASAEELPLAELGFGIGAINMPYYPGSSEQRNVVFPVPLPIYRGHIFKSDDQGTRADLIQNSRFDLDLSADFNFAVDSDDVDIREGMDDIGSVLQIGPSLATRLFETDHSDWTVVLPLRANIEISEDGIDERGFTFAPTLYYTQFLELGGERWRARASLGASFASSSFQELYYGVPEEFATAERRRYSADAGFSGLRAQFSIRSLNRKRLWVGFVRYDDVSAATFHDSPLVETTGGISIGFIYARMFWRSKATVERQAPLLAR